MGICMVVAGLRGVRSGGSALCGAGGDARLIDAGGDTILIDAGGANLIDAGGGGPFGSGAKERGGSLIDMACGGSCDRLVALRGIVTGIFMDTACVGSWELAFEGTPLDTTAAEVDD